MNSAPASAQRRAQFKTAAARKLRASATDAERKLWSLLRGKQVAGLRFRRQQPLGPYIADFYCSGAKLVVELDGSQHGEPKNVAHDEARTRWMESRGMKVLRFANVDVLKQSEAIVDSIYRIAASNRLQPCASVGE